MTSGWVSIFANIPPLAENRFTRLTNPPPLGPWRPGGRRKRAGWSPCSTKKGTQAGSGTDGDQGGRGDASWYGWCLRFATVGAVGVGLMEGEGEGEGEGMLVKVGLMVMVMVGLMEAEGDGDGGADGFDER